MPVAGERKSKLQLGRGYATDPMTKYVASFKDVMENILHESSSSLLMDPSTTLMMESAEQSLRDFFVENSVDKDSLSPEEYDDHIEMMNEQFTNDKEAILEYANTAAYNPVIGMSFPIHKNILMNNIFDKGAIPKLVAMSPKFTLSLETRYLITPDGEEIDMFKDQDQMTAAMDASVPFVEVPMTLPENGTTDILAGIGASSLDNVSIESYISGVKVKLHYEIGDILPDGNGIIPATGGTAAVAAQDVDTWIKVKLLFNPGYGDFDRQLMRKVVLPSNTVGGASEEVVSGTMRKNRLVLFSSSPKILAVKFNARKDTSNAMLHTCSVKWDVRTDFIEIPSAIPINVPIAPEEVKDIGALYQINQLTKIMSMIKLSLENYKDDKILINLKDSFSRLDPSQKFDVPFDFAPREGYALDHVEWRHRTLMDFLDTHISDLLTVLNDPNVVITIFGRPDLIRKVTPTSYDYTSPSSIGPVELDFVKTVTTSDKRVYQFISSQKLKNSNELIIILNPRNSDRIIYRIYDYQMYVSNEIRNAMNPSLPAVHAFERWKFVEYQPVQARLTILNPSGLVA